MNIELKCPCNFIGTRYFVSCYRIYIWLANTLLRKYWWRVVYQPGGLTITESIGMYIDWEEHFSCQ